MRQGRVVLCESHSRQSPRLTFVWGHFLAGGTSRQSGAALFSFSRALCSQTAAVIWKSSSSHKGHLWFSGTDF